MKIWKGHLDELNQSGELTEDSYFNPNSQLAEGRQSSDWKGLCKELKSLKSFYKILKVNHKINQWNNVSKNQGGYSPYQKHHEASFLQENQKQKQEKSQI